MSRVFEPLPIAVVIPAYNAAATIRRAIESVYRQTRQPSEILVVDDGSSDDTAAIARAAGARVIVQSNGGSGSARNAGIRATNQPWVALLDADDEWWPRKLAMQWRAVRMHPGVGIVATDFCHIRRDGSYVASVMKSAPSFLRVPRAGGSDGAVLLERGPAALQLATGYFLLPSSLLISSEVFAAGNVFLERSELIETPLCAEGEDFEWALRALRASDLVVVEEQLVTYHALGDSFSSNFGRIRYGDVKLGERVRANPAAYVAGVADAFASVRAATLRAAVIEFLRSGDIASARVVQSEALADRTSPANVGLYAVLRAGDNGLGRSALALLRAVWKRGLKRLLRRRPSAEPAAGGAPSHASYGFR